MIFNETNLKGAFTIQPEEYEDERGFLAQSFSRQQFEQHGLNPNVSECNISYNRRKGTLRGMHYQEDPFGQAKLVRCTRGSIYDVVIDLRPNSATFKRWVGVQLTADNRRMFYVPEGFAHGFLTLSDDTEVFYQVSSVYAPEFARGVRWNDPAFGIEWPEPQLIIIERDRTYPDFAG